MPKVFFATDVHGSETCWKKFISAGKFYGAEILILGGDMTGKTIIPILKTADKGTYKYKLTFLEQAYTCDTEAELKNLETTIRKRGFYPVRMDYDQLAELQGSPEKAEQLFIEQAVKTLEGWLEYATEKLRNTGISCYVCPGNDDMFEIDEVIKKSDTVKLAEGKVVALNDVFTLVSTGWSNETPWSTFRELPENELGNKIEGMLQGINDFSTCIFNFHCPPFKSGLDDAPELDKNMRPKYAGNSLVPVGSQAVRSIVEKYQPALGLFGHIHEARAIRKFNKAVCINPGSSYEQGILLGALVELDLGRRKIKNWVLTSG